MGAIWKDRYLRLLADLENTKKTLERTSSQGIEAHENHTEGYF
jgi:molecular chaperone GrpE